MRRWVLATSAALAACDPCGVSCATQSGLTPTVRLGVGVDAFTAVDDGDTVDFVLGPQGRYHLVAALQAYGVRGGVAGTLGSNAPCNPDVSFDVLHDDVPDVDGPMARGLSPLDDGLSSELLGVVVPVAVGTAAQIDGQTVTLAVTVADTCGTVVQDAHEVTLAYAGEVFEIP